MLGRTLRVEKDLVKEGAVVLGTLDQLRPAAPRLAPDGSLKAEGFRLKTVETDGLRYLVIAGWFFKTSGIADEKRRMENYPGRMESESMQWKGYVSKPVIHFETASGATAVRCPEGRRTARFIFKGDPGWHTLRIRYFDYAQGAARFHFFVAGQLVDSWIADDTLPTRRTEPGGTSSTRRVVTGVALRPGDEIRIEGIPDGSEDAALDYIEILPDK